MVHKRSPVVMYSTRFCGYCLRARQLLARKGVEFEDIQIDLDWRKRSEMEQRSHRYTVPQIFIGERHIGGYDEMTALERQGKLDALLGLNEP